MADRAVSAEARVFEALDRSASQIVLLVDADFRLVWVNQHGSRFLGEAATPGRMVIDRIHPDDLASALVVLTDAVERADERAGSADGGGTISIRVLDAKDEFVHVDASMSNLLADPDVEGLLIHLHPTSDRRLLDTAVERLAAEANLPEVLEATARFFTEEMRAVAASVATRIDGENIVVGTDRHTDDEALIAYNLGWGPGGPQKLTEPAMYHVDELDGSVAAIAVSRGVEWVIALPVEHGDGRLSGAIVAWVAHRPIHVDPPQGPGRFAVRLTRLAILQERSRRSLVHQAHHDALTGLANRAGLDRAVAGIRDEQLPVGLICCDLDDFKAVNDTLGHLVGDQMLRLVGRRIEDAIRIDDIGVRLGGDEFVVLLPSTPAKEMPAIVSRLRTRIETPSGATGTDLAPSVSIGWAVAETPAQLGSVFDRADEALYDDKRSRAARR